MRIRLLAIFVALIAPAAHVLAADEAQTGAYHATFTDRSPLSPLDVQARRFGWKMADLMASQYEKDYDLKNESFEVNVPDSYKAGDGWGLLVWVSAGGGGNLHQGWRDVLEKHKLMWIGPNKVGNERAIWCRMGLAIDAAHNMKERYDINPNRVFIAGASGGGRISSMLGVCYPDVFKGGMYIIGCNYFREMTAPNSGGQVWHRGYAPPPGDILIQAKKNVSHVLLTGETDPNREQTKEYFEKGFKKDGFLHVTYIEVPGMGHQPPNAEWFEKGLVAMEDLKPPVAATLPAKTDAPKPIVEKEKSPAAVSPAAEGTPAQEAEKLLRNARLYIQNQLNKQARERLENLIAKYPDTPAAKEAKEILKQLPAE